MSMRASQGAKQSKRISFAPDVGGAREPSATRAASHPLPSTPAITGPPAASGGGSTGGASAEFWQTAPSLRQLTADPAFLSSATMRRTLAAAAAAGGGSGGSGDDGQDLLASVAVLAGGRPAYIDVDGPVNAEETLIRYDVPFAPSDPARSLRLRRRLGMMPGATGAAAPAGDRGGAADSFTATTSGLGANNEGHSLRAAEVDPNVRAVLDAFIVPRRWVDAKTGVEWVQHAWPFPSSRTATVETEQRLQERLRTLGARRTGTCPIRTLLVAECFLEVMRQVVAECWERGLLLLYVHAERVAAQAAHRELFESRVGHAMRLALKGERDALRAQEDITALKARVAGLEAEERELRTLCGEFAAAAEEQVLIEEKRHSEALNALRKEGLLKRNQLEQMLAVPPPQ